MRKKERRMFPFWRTKKKYRLGSFLSCGAQICFILCVCYGRTRVFLCTWLFVLFAFLVLVKILSCSLHLFLLPVWLYSRTSAALSRMFMCTLLSYIFVWRNPFVIVIIAFCLSIIFYADDHLFNIKLVYQKNCCCFLVRIAKSTNFHYEAYKTFGICVTIQSKWYWIVLTVWCTARLNSHSKIYVRHHRMWQVYSIPFRIYKVMENTFRLSSLDQCFDR